MILTIRKAQPDDIAWVNAQYQQVHFQLSNYSNELIVIAEANGEKAGVGRLVTVDENTLELGGMYVPESFRRFGVARTIVTFLVAQVTGKTLFCLPFEHLQHFYESCGFKPVADPGRVPPKVLQKWEWCNQVYPHKTLLLTRQV
ncbi:GNAT family N-acetyltransferase [Pontibacter sp. Tf4]|uniref:GNAT family N-acetyltransferase n=1 Tax=Pontibacter sp. Tf4 TaxID=2761620 RepID=UPI0016294493|nr:GNAT family N-acetyltransferase [Pontibacter sp. Tf4]